MHNVDIPSPDFAGASDFLDLHIEFDLAFQKLIRERLSIRAEFVARETRISSVCGGRRHL